MSIDRCLACNGDGFIIGEEYEAGCCGNYLRTGECCAAMYGTANLVPIPVEVQVQCSACGGEGVVREE